MKRYFNPFVFDDARNLVHFLFGSFKNTNFVTLNQQFYI